MIMLMLLLMSTFTLSSNISLTLADNAADVNSDSDLAPQKINEQNFSSPTILHDGSLSNKFSDQGKLEEGNSRLSSRSSENWNFSEANKWVDFVKVDNVSMEIVVGLNYEKPNSYDELKHIIAENDGELVNTISVKGKVQAAVGDIPLESASSFTEEVQAAGLSRYIEPNMKFNTNYVPNDPYWSYQWGPAKIEADYAWDTTVGDPSVLVAVIDTGIDWDHPDLADNYVDLGYDWVHMDPDPMDDNGHGTHCAGIIAAAINNSIGIAGLAQISIMAEKGLDAYGSGWEDDLASAIIHAVDQGADILSNSWGGYGASELIHEAVIYAYDHDVLVIAAAGNDATSTKFYPAAYDGVLAVTATDRYDDPAWFTNFGDWVELAAPGVDIYSTVWNDSYTYKSGTSMATPHVAGVAALILSQFPNMTRDQVRLQLRFTADDLGDPGFDYYCGYGRINARRAVEQAPPDHDLLILDWEKPRFVKLGDVAIVNTTVFNFGACNETDITVQLLVNGSVVDSATIDFLETATSETVNCSWTPTIEGTYNLTSYVVPVPSETLIENNFVTAMVCAEHFKHILFDQTHGTDSIIYYSIWVTDLTERGYVVDAHTSAPITPTVLAGYMALVIPQAHDLYGLDELSAIQNFVIEGGGLLVIGDDAPSVYTDLTGFSGISWVSGGVSGITTDITPHEVTCGVTSVYLDAPIAEMIVSGCAEDLVRDPAGGIMLAVSEQPGRVIGFADEGSLWDYGITWEDNLRLADNMIDWLVVRPEHDLSVTMEAPPYVEPGGSSLLNVTIRNGGLNNETNVELFLFINGTTVKNVTIPELISDSSYTIDYLWTPIVEEVLYNVTGYTIPVENETVILNNLECVFVYVGYPLKVFVLDSAGTDFPGIISTWQVLSTNWYVFGDQMLLIDYSTLNKEDITYEDLAAIDADVLIISCASDPWSGWEFTDSEIEAISQYVHEGHGLVATSGTFYSMVPNNNKLAPLFGINEAMMYEISDTDLLHIQDPTHPLFINVPNPYIFPQTATTIPSDGHWDSNELVGGEYVALGHFQESAIVVFRGLVYISPLLEYGIPPYYHFHLQLLYNAITWSRYQKPEHELVVSLGSPAALKPGESTLLNATVSNMGLSNETDVELFLLIDGVEANSTTIPLLINGTSYAISHLWSPTVEANYNVTAYVSPVPNEDTLSNNVESKGVIVSSLVVALFKNVDPWGYPSNEEALSLYGIPYFVFSSSDFGSVDLSAFTKVVIASVQDQDFYNAMDAYRWWFEAYVSSGGVLEIHAAHYTGTGWVGTLPGDLQYVQNLRDYVTIFDPTHPVVTMPNYITDPELDNWYYSVHGCFGTYPVNSHIVMIEDSTGYPAYLEFQYGAGFIVASSQTLEWAYSHGYSLILENSLLYSPVKYQHELAVTLETPTFLELDESTMLNATVGNHGLSNETDVELFLLINGTVVNSTTISNLLTGECYTINYLWTPTLEVIYNVTAYAPPVPDEEFTSNNVKSMMVIVSYAPKILAYVQYTDYDQEYANALGAIDLTFGPNYLLSELWDYTQLDSMLPENDILFIPEQEYTSLPTMEMIGESWSTTLSNFMVEGGVMIVCDYSGGSYGILTGAGLMSISGVNYITGSTVYLVDPSDPLAESVSNTFIAPNGALSFITTETNVVFNDGTCPVVIHKRIGSGQIALIGFDYYASNPDADQILGNAVGLAIRYEHDIAASLQVPTFLKLGDSSLLNATVLNGGLSNETNLELFLLINGTTVDNAMIPELLTGSSYTLSHLWTPTIEAIYNVTAYAPPVPGENVTANNFVSKMVHVRYVTVALISDQSQLLAITPVLDSMGVGYDIYNDNSFYLYTEDLSLLLDYPTVIFYQYNRLITSGEHSTLLSYLSSGGNLLVTGYDSLGSPSDTLLADVVRSSSVGDNTGEPDLYVVDSIHPIMNGPYGSFPTGYHISGLYSDCDAAEADTGRNAITAAELADGYDKIIATEGLPGKVVYWNGIGPDDWTWNVDCEAMFKNTIVWFTIRYEHDLAVSLDAQTLLELGDSSLLNATVYNHGLSNETNVELKLSISGYVVNSTTIAEFDSGSFYTLNYLWTPTVEGTYNITAYAPPLVNETFTENNIVTKTVVVGGIPELPTDRPAVYVSPQIVTPALGETFTISVDVFNLTDVYIPDPLGNLYGFDIQFTWDPTILEYVSHTVTVPVEDYPNGVLHEPFMQLKDVVDEDDAIPHAEPGTRAWFAYSSMFPAEPFNNPEESNTVFFMTFRVIGEGTTDLEFVSTALGTRLGEHILHASLNGLVVVGALAENHDVAIANVTSYPNAVYAGRIVNITVVAANEGTVAETFNITVYYNLTTIETQTVYDLAPGANITVTFRWNTTGLTPCSNFTIWAEASPVPYELNLDNNFFTDGWVKIKMLGDINGDGKVDLYDAIILCKAYGSREGDPEWNPEADLAPEWGIINLYDAVTLNLRYGQSC